MNYQAKGHLISKYPIERGQTVNGDWEKRVFVIQQAGPNKPQTIAFTAWGDLTDTLEGFERNELITVDFRIKSQLSGNRWFTELRAFKIESGNGSKQTTSTDPQYGRGHRDYGYEDQDRFSDD